MRAFVEKHMKHVSKKEVCFYSFCHCEDHLKHTFNQCHVKNLLKTGEKTKQIFPIAFSCT